MISRMIFSSVVRHSPTIQSILSINQAVGRRITSQTIHSTGYVRTIACNALSAISLQNQHIQQTRRNYSSKESSTLLPFTQRKGSKITASEYEQISAQVDRLSQAYLSQPSRFKKHEDAKKYLNQLETTKEPQKTEVSKYAKNHATNKPATVTAGLAVWRSHQLRSVNISPKGTLHILNSDKEILLKLMACHAAKKDIVFENQTASTISIYEGVDNGDALGLDIPLKSHFGSNISKATKIFLTNGSDKKLKEAAAFAHSLLPTNDSVYSSMSNPFYDGIPTELVHFPDHQKFFYFFRLVMVESPSKIQSFIKERLEYMRPQDLAIGSFLLADSDAQKMAMIKNRYELDRSNDNAVVYKKRLPEFFLQEKLNLLSKEGKEDPYRYLTTFEEEAVHQMIQEAGGCIINSSFIPTTTDDGDKIKILGVIFKKATS